MPMCDWSSDVCSSDLSKGQLDCTYQGHLAGAGLPVRLAEEKLPACRKKALLQLCLADVSVLYWWHKRVKEHPFEPRFPCLSKSDHHSRGLAGPNGGVFGQSILSLPEGRRSQWVEGKNVSECSPPLLAPGSEGQCEAHRRMVATSKTRWNQLGPSWQ